MLHGKHLIAGEWIGGVDEFANAPVTGAADKFAVGLPAHVDSAVQAAEEAYATYASSSRQTRANFLRRIAEEIDARGAEITDIGVRETGLPEARLEGERGRTTEQLRLFADHIEAPEYLDMRHDPALPERAPLPRPDLRLMQYPVGPVAVFGASNFPLAFSVAGGDTASALAVGCPVVVKGHSAHPGTSELVAQAIEAAIKYCALPPGIFSLVQGGTRATGQRLVQHPLICAVGFTGSLAGGRALFDLCASRPEPIPFFGELGSINPMFILPAALSGRGEEIATGWAASLTMGAGQFCTNPGVAIVVDSPEADSFIMAAKTALAQVDTQFMLTDGIAQSFSDGCAQVAGQKGVKAVMGNPTNGETRRATPQLFLASGADWLANPELAEEVFGPLGMVIVAKDIAEMQKIAQGLKGQLTCTLHLSSEDHDLARMLLPILQRKAGRVLANGFPTGVEVADAMVHGGPYPASTNFGHTSVGTLSIRRWLRPVCLQNLPEALLPEDLKTL